MNKILIIEDDQIVANIYRNKFSLEGFRVEVALDGQAGLDMIHSFKPDAVVLDLMLPKMTGVDLMKQIRAEPEYGQVPIIVFSNTYMTDMMQQAWKAGATKCLSKSNCTPKQVIDIVRTTLSANGQLAQESTPLQPAPIQSAAQPRATAQEPVPAATTEGDAAFQADLRKSFVDTLATTLTGLRGLLQAVIKADNDQTRVKYTQELYRRVHGVTSNAGIAGIVLIAQMADALEALLKELHEKPKNINASTLRTVASAIDFLGILFDRWNSLGDQDPSTASILVVDDEAISRRAVTYALEKAKLKSVNVEDPATAYKLLTESKFDLVFLDVDMPGMNGFELCTKLRTLPAHKKTPVVFVTSLTDFESRASSTISGGNDFIAKPFLFIELAVKALVYVLRGRLVPAK